MLLLLDVALLVGWIELKLSNTEYGEGFRIFFYPYSNPKISHS